MTIRSMMDLAKAAGIDWLDNKAPRLGAALAYYAIFSMAPLLLISISVAGLVFGRDAAQGHLFGQIRGLVGDEGGAALEAMVAKTSEPGSSALATVVGIGMLLVGAAGLFGQLQDALNTIWHVQARPGRGIWGFVQDRFLSFSMVLGCAFLLLVSLVVSTTLAALDQWWGSWMAGMMAQVTSLVVSFGVVTLLFAMIFRFLPDAVIAWRDVWLGAIVTSLLFSIGKLAIGLYLGHSAVGSAYGAAGSLAVLLIWIYYASQIFLFGAELTKVCADRYGSGVVPSENALAIGSNMENGLHASQPRPGQLQVK